jgi:hypothetical protein
LQIKLKQITHEERQFEKVEELTAAGKFKNNASADPILNSQLVSLEGEKPRRSFDEDEIYSSPISYKPGDFIVGTVETNFSKPFPNAAVQSQFG